MGIGSAQLFSGIEELLDWSLINRIVVTEGFQHSWVRSITPPELREFGIKATAKAAQQSREFGLAVRVKGRLTAKMIAVLTTIDECPNIRGKSYLLRKRQCCKTQQPNHSNNKMFQKSNNYHFITFPYLIG
ncbi:hypothetical protein [Brucella pituitosa]|uniref:hypothetical protein n=1 Tax=Brucella pituitosa TaxID=571256 RepID=UPI0009A1B809|nr:hypothetical protein [Brucella pituitosa]